MGHRLVYFEPSGKLHPSFRYLLDYPPPGYAFTLGNGTWERLVGGITRMDALYYNVWRLADVLPVNLVKSRLERFVRKPPKETCLTFSINHIVCRDEPWIVLIEWVHMLSGFWMPEFSRHKQAIEKALGGDWCKRVLTWCEPARNSILANLDCRAFRHKIDILPLAAPPVQFVKTFEERVRLLFVGSANTPRGMLSSLALADVYDFHIKGGKEVLQAFARLKPAYPDLELVVRARVPAEIQRRYRHMPGLTIIEDQVTRQRLEREFQSADIYLFPCHQTTPWASLLEAMSYELPVIATDVFANPELVDDGRTGFLVRGAEKIPYYDENERFIPSMVTPKRREFLRALEQVDEQLVDELVAKTKILVEDTALRRTMGRAARWEVEHGKHSLGHRNAKLKAILDEAVTY